MTAAARPHGDRPLPAARRLELVARRVRLAGVALVDLAALLDGLGDVRAVDVIARRRHVRPLRARRLFAGAYLVMHAGAATAVWDLIRRGATAPAAYGVAVVLVALGMLVVTLDLRHEGRALAADVRAALELLRRLRAEGGAP